VGNKANSSASLKKNMLYNTAYQVLVILLPLITAPYVSRVLGVDGLGTYSYVFSIASYFGLFGLLGIANHGNRSIALDRNEDDRISQTFWNIYSVQFVTTLLATIAYIVFVFFIFDGDKTIACINIILLLSYVLDITWCFFGLEQFAITVTRNAIIKVVTVALIFVFIRSAEDVWKYALIMSLGTFFSQLYLWFNLHRFIHIKRPLWREVKRDIKPILILFIPAISYSVYKLLDKVMLGSMTSVGQVGLFDNAEKIVNIPTGLITAFGTVMMPRISLLLANHDTKQIDYLNKLSFRYFTILVVASSFGLAGISSVLAPVYFGSEFVGSAPLIAGLGFSLIFVTWANIIRTQYLIPNKLDKEYVISTIIGAVVNLVANIILIPHLSAVGAMIGTILAEFVVFLSQAIFVRRQFNSFSYICDTLALFPIGLIMFFVVRAVGNTLGLSITTLVVQILVGGVIFCIGTLFFLLYKHDSFLARFTMKIHKK
jgi:O-antigen/teichoic acid export membrane protein